MWIHDIPDELLLTLYSGRSAAPPSLAWLHWSRELLICHDRLSDRQQKTLLFLLRQLVWRTARDLRSITSAVHEKASLIALNKSISTDPTQSDTSLSSPRTPSAPTNSPRRIGSEEEFVQLPMPNDDDTVACVEDLIQSKSQPWPADCASLNQILAQALVCLVPSSLFRQLDPFVLGSSGSCSRRVRTISVCAHPNRSDVLGSDDEFIPASNEAVQLYGGERFDSVLGCVTPVWIQKVNKLLIERQWCSEISFLPPTNPIWWCSHIHELADSTSEELKVLALWYRCFFI